MATLTLLSLPDELLVHILSYLPPSDVLSAQLTSHHLNTIVTNSVWLQYRTLLEAAQYSDNPSSPLGIRDRLSALKGREKAWASLTPASTKEIDLQHQPCKIFSIADGVYLSGDKAGRSLFWLQPPPQHRDEPVWRVIDMGPELLVVNIGLCVYEHDLIGVVTTSPHPSMFATFTTELHLLQFSASFSSSRPTSHPLAAQNPLHILNFIGEEPTVWFEIVGDHLVLIIVFLDTPDEPDRVLVHNWRSGHVVAQFGAPRGSYYGIVFLTERWFLLPNAEEGRLEVYEIPPCRDAHVDGTIGIELTPIHILALPVLEEHRHFRHITCRADPNPISKRCTKLHTTTPCYPSPEDAIIVFILNVSNLQLLWEQYGLQVDLSMYVHRRALLEICRRDTVSRSPTGQSNGDLPPPSGSISASTPPLIPYRSWGPPITRWFNTDEIPLRRITTTAGQRAVIISDFANEDAAPYVVIDFNQGNVQQAKRALGYCDEGENSSETGADNKDPDDDKTDTEGDDSEDVSSDSSKNVGKGRQRALRRGRPICVPDSHPDTDSPDPKTHTNRWLTTAFHSVEHTDVFDLSEQPVGGSLPYVACSSAKEYMWDGVMIDGERVFMETSDQEGKVQVDFFG